MEFISCACKSALILRKRGNYSAKTLLASFGKHITDPRRRDHPYEISRYQPNIIQFHGKLLSAHFHREPMSKTWQSQTRELLVCNKKSSRDLNGDTKKLDSETEKVILLLKNLKLAATVFPWELIRKKGIIYVRSPWLQDWAWIHRRHAEA